jgi:hypothetical protein
MPPRGWARRTLLLQFPLPWLSFPLRDSVPLFRSPMIGSLTAVEVSLHTAAGGVWEQRGKTLYFDEVISAKGWGRKKRGPQASLLTALCNDHSTTSARIPFLAPDACRPGLPLCEFPPQQKARRRIPAIRAFCRHPSLCQARELRIFTGEMSHVARWVHESKR